MAVADWLSDCLGADLIRSVRETLEDERVREAMAASIPDRDVVDVLRRLRLCRSEPRRPGTFGERREDRSEASEMVRECVLPIRRDLLPPLREEGV